MVLRTHWRTTHKTTAIDRVFNPMIAGAGFEPRDLRVSEIFDFRKIQILRISILWARRALQAAPPRCVLSDFAGPKKVCLTQQFAKMTQGKGNWFAEDRLKTVRESELAV